jgi:HD-like signal output (HDOD) protein
LTNKLLKLVNSSFYGGLGKGVTSISQAVVILGVDQVRLTAAATMLFTQMREKSAMEELRDSMVKSFMSGIVAMDLANEVKVRKMEMGFLCAMFQNLGKNLTIYYFPEEYSEIKALMNKNGLDIHSAAHAILGISLDELGVCVARHWKFPENIIYGMRSLPEGVVDKPNSTLEMLRHFAVFANELCELASNTLSEQREYLLSRLVQRFEPSFSISEKNILTLLHSAIEKIRKYSTILNINPEQSHFIQSLFRFADDIDGTESSHADEDPFRHKPGPAQTAYQPVNNGDSGLKGKYGNDEIQSMHTKKSVALHVKLLQRLVNVAHKMNWR